MKKRISILVLGVVTGIACSDRTTKTDEEAERLCTTYCERFDECDVPPELPEDECSETCVGFDWAWRGACRKEEVALYECINALSCDEFSVSEDFNSEVTPKPCEAERSASSICISDHGGIPSDG